MTWRKRLTLVSDVSVVFTSHTHARTRAREGHRRCARREVAGGGGSASDVCHLTNLTAVTAQDAFFCIQDCDTLIWSNFFCIIWEAEREGTHSPQKMAQQERLNETCGQLIGLIALSALIKYVSWRSCTNQLSFFLFYLTHMQLWRPQGHANYPPLLWFKTVNEHNNISISDKHKHARLIIHVSVLSHARGCISAISCCDAD